MRNVSKWSLCFRPPSTIEIEDGVDCSADRMLSLISAARNSNRMNKKKKKKNSPKTLESSIPDHNPPPKTSRRSFSSVVRAVMFETSLSRRVREAKSRNRSDQSVRTPPSDQEPSATADHTTAVEKSAIAVDRETTDTIHAAENTCWPPPASVCRFKSVPEKSKQGEIGAGSTVRINPIVCLVLVSLWVTVFWGRVCAVMTTTVWIYAWQSGVVVVGLGEMLKLRKMKKKGGETENVTDSLSAKGNELIERGVRGN